MKGGGPSPTPEFVARVLHTVEQNGQGAARGAALIEGGEATHGQASRPGSGIRLAFRGGDGHGVAVSDHRVKQGVAVDTVGIAEMDEPHGSSPPGPVSSNPRIFEPPNS